MATLVGIQSLRAMSPQIHVYNVGHLIECPSLGVLLKSNSFKVSDKVNTRKGKPESTPSLLCLYVFASLLQNDVILRGIYFGSPIKWISSPLLITVIFSFGL